VTCTIYGANYEAQFLGADALDSSLTLATFIKDCQLATKLNPSTSGNPGVYRTTESGAFGLNDYKDVFV
jgi:hypothetical protein